MTVNRHVKSSPQDLYINWLTIVTIGEFIGFIIPSVVGVVSVTANIPQIPQALLMILAGIGEGTVLGYAQSRILTHLAPKIKTSDWVTVTVVGAATAWLIGMIPSTFFDYIKNASIIVIIPIALLLAVTFLFSIGYMQYLILRRFFSRAHLWIWANMLAWVCGLIVLFACMFIAPNGFWQTLIFSILGGLGMALTMAAITGAFLLKIVTKK